MEDSDGEIEAEEDGSNISGQIKKGLAKNSCREDIAWCSRVILIFRPVDK